MSKTITIDEFLERNKDILKGNYVYYSAGNEGEVSKYKPTVGKYDWKNDPSELVVTVLSYAFNIAPYQGDWKKSLRRVKE